MRLRSTIALLTLTCFAIIQSGCASTGQVGGTGASIRDPQAARDLHAKASAILSSSPVEAESLLRAAISTDLYHGPSHNNLGVLLLQQGKLYEAAEEFEWARKLMPGHPDPRVNLAMTLERAGKTNDALMAYDAALDVFPNYLPALQGKAMIHVTTRQFDESTQGMLSEIALRGNTDWREWAQRQQSRPAP